MKKRMLSTPRRSPQEPRIPRAISDDQIRAEEAHLGLAGGWRTWEGANSSVFFNWLVCQPNRTLVAGARRVVEDWIYFEDHSWELDARARATLADKLPLFQANPAMRIVIGGIVSHQETLKFGMKLGLRRVLSIRTCLLAYGIDPDRIGIAVRGAGWFLVEDAGGAGDLDGRCTECRLQVTDRHWVLAKN